MRAEDSVMSRKTKQALIVARSHQQTTGESQEDMLLKAQAEITAKIMIKEVVDWVKKNCFTVVNEDARTVMIGPVGNSKIWKAKLKEWGIDASD